MLLDASAVIAYLLKETGAERVEEALLKGSAMSTVNFAEVVSRYVRKGASDDAVQRLRARLWIRLVPFDAEMSTEAGRLVRHTGSFGLSLGDRCCLATARITGDPVLTADRVWREVGSLIGVDVQLIR
jgi:ribonuclease VapC